MFSMLISKLDIYCTYIKEHVLDRLRSPIQSQCISSLTMKK